MVTFLVLFFYIYYLCTWLHNHIRTNALQSRGFRRFSRLANSLAHICLIIADSLLPFIAITDRHVTHSFAQQIQFPPPSHCPPKTYLYFGLQNTSVSRTTSFQIKSQYASIGPTLTQFVRTYFQTVDSSMVESHSIDTYSWFTSN